MVGASFAVKDHYILAAIPFGLCLLMRPLSLIDRLRTASLFSLAVFVGLSIDFLLHRWLSGSFLGHFSFNSGYSERLAAWGRGPDVIGVHLFLRRTQYIRYLLYDAGILSGFLTVLGTIYLFLNGRRRVDCALVASMLAMYLVFMMATPAGIHPFRLVEMQGCYLRIVLPFLAIGCGGAMAKFFEVLHDDRLRRAMVAALVIGFGTNVFVPDTTASPTFELCWNREADGIRETLKEGRQRGIEELWLPAEEECEIPDSFYKLGTKIHYYESSKTLPVESVLAALKADPKRAVLVRRKNLHSPLIPFVVAGHFTTGCDILNNDRPIAELLQKAGCESIRLEVPATVLGGWLAYFGTKQGDRILAGWVCRFRPATTADEPVKNPGNDIAVGSEHDPVIVLSESEEPPIDPAGLPKKGLQQNESH
jgi:hypothetical protein